MRRVCRTSHRAARLRRLDTNTARGEPKTPILTNRGEIGGKDREHVPKEPRERDSKFGVYLGLRFQKREKRGVPIRKTRAHNPKVVGSNPAPATKITTLTCENGQGFFIAGESSGRKCLPLRPFLAQVPSLLIKVKNTTKSLIKATLRIVSRGNSGGIFSPLHVKYGVIRHTRGNRNPNPRRCISPIDSSERGPFPLPECDSEAYPLILSERTRNAPWWDERAASGITEADGKKRPVVDTADGGASCPTSSRFPTSDPTRRWMTSTPPPIPIPSDAPTP